ncbi:MAG: helix-turn-helix transcriptional regulator, partial [Clostridia bacterium]|nr:helix-turn-helix transcriptional regulator [Clostridia bacterium]
SLQGLLPSVLELGENTSSYRIRLTVTAFLYSILIEVSNQYVREEHSFGERKELGKIYEIIEFVNQNLSKDLSLDAIAADFYLSKSQLSRSFKKATGSTLWDYVLIKRLFLARSLIREGESISGACERSGFREYSSFYRAYKKRFGISPNQDRAMIDEPKD